MILDSFPSIESMIPRGCEVTIQPGGLGKVKAMWVRLGDVSRFRMLNMLEVRFVVMLCYIVRYVKAWCLMSCIDASFYVWVLAQQCFWWKHKNVVVCLNSLKWLTLTGWDFLGSSIVHGWPLWMVLDSCIFPVLSLRGASCDVKWVEWELNELILVRRDFIWIIFLFENMRVR